MSEPNNPSQRHVDPKTLLALAERVPDLLCVASTDGYFNWVSPRWTEVLGWDRDELLSRRFLDFVHPSDRERTASEFSRLSSGQETIHFQNRYRLPDGTYRWLEWSATPGEGGLLFGVARDVTAVRATQRNLEERRRLLELAEGLAGIGHWHLDLVDSTLFWSPHVYVIHGRDPTTFTPTLDNAIEAYHPDDRDQVSEAIATVIGTRETGSFKLRIVRPSGEVRTVQARGMPEVNQDGEVTSVFGIFRDITDEIRMEEMVRRTERMASLGTMAAGIAHEINNPLGYLLGNLELLEDELSPADGEGPGQGVDSPWEMLQDAVSGAVRIRKIVDGMRAFSRVPDTERGPVDPLRVVDSAVQMASHELRPRARLLTHLEQTAAVVGEETQLVQVTLNLLINAAQAIPPGAAAEHEVRVNLTQEDSWVVIQVSDTGPGIPPELRDRIFDPFFTTKPVGTGTGLGLSIAHSIMTQHGGTIEVEDRTGGGTLVTLRLPVTEIPLPEPQTGASVSETEHDHQRPRLLVVDDEPQVLKLLQRALEGDFEIVAAASGREALAILKRDRVFDLILCDLMMPDVTGEDVYRYLQGARPELASRLAVATGGAFTPGAEAFLETESVPVIRKPFDLLNLRQELRTLARS